MDFFQHRYYKLNKILMTLIGQWPYRSVRLRRGFLAVVVFLNVTQIVPQILALLKYRDDRKIVLEGALSLFFEGAYVIRLIFLVCNSQMTLKLLNRIRTDWQVWARDQEVDILHEYADIGEKINIVYSAMMYSTLVVFMSQPVILKIFDVFMMNGTAPGKFPFPVDYYHLDMQKYWFYIIIYSCVCICMMSTAFIASEVMFITYVQHGCAIFAALGHKLERIGDSEKAVDIEETPYALDKSDLDHLASCINRHNDAIEYANLIETSNTWSTFLMIGFGMIQINVTGLQILSKKNDLEETLRFVCSACAVMLIFLIDSLISQILTDHSASIRFCILNSQWYRLSVKAQKLLQLMTIRCDVPCQLTAGKILTMSLRSLLLTARAAMSYFTFVRSM